MNLDIYKFICLYLLMEDIYKYIKTRIVNTEM